jgi:hypothetical protein
MESELTLGHSAGALSRSTRSSVSMPVMSSAVIRIKRASRRVGADDRLTGEPGERIHDHFLTLRANLAGNPPGASPASRRLC